MTKKVTFLIIIIFYLGSYIFSQNNNVFIYNPNKRVNSGWFGEIKNILVSPRSNYILVQGNEYIHIFESKSLNQIAVLKNFKRPKSCFFYSDSQVIIINLFGTIKYDIKNLKIEKISSKNYNCGYVDTKTQIMYLSDSSNIDVYEKLKITDSFLQKNLCTSIYTTKKYLIVGCQNGEINLYSKKNYKLKQVLKGHKSAVVKLHYNSQNNIFVSASEKNISKRNFGEAIIWDFNTNKIIFNTYDTHREALYINSYKDKIFISDMENIKIYNKEGKVIKTILESWFSHPAFSIIEDKLIYNSSHGNESERIFIVDLNSYSKIKMFGHDSKQIWDLSFFKNNLVITKARESSVIDSGIVYTFPIYTNQDVKTYKTIGQISGMSLINEDLSNRAISFNILNKKFNSVTYPDSVKDKIFSADFIEYKNNFFIISNEYLINLTQKNSVVNFQIPISKNNFLSDFEGDYFNIISPVRKFITNDSTFLFYEFDIGEFILNIRNANNGKVLKQITKVKYVFTQQGDYLNYLTINGSVCSINLNTFEIIEKKDLPNSNIILDAKFNNNRNLIVLKYDGYGNSIAIVDVKNNKTIPIYSESMVIDCFEFTPNNKYLLMGNRYGEIEIWRVEDGKYIGLIFTGSIKNDYVITTQINFDGTENGIKNFLESRSSKNYTRKVGLLNSIFFE